MFIIVLILSVFGVFNITNIHAEEIDSPVYINEATFPDKYIRWYVGKVVDINGDGVLQQDEIERIECMKLNYEGEDRNDPLFSNTINCKGLEIFTNMKVLYVAPNITKSSNIYNLEVVNNMPKLVELYIAGCHQREMNIDFSNFPNLKILNLYSISKINKIDLSQNIKLEELRLNTISNLDKLNLSKNTELTDIEIRDVSGNVVIDLSNLKNLANVTGYSLKVKGLKFGKLKKITTLELGISSGTYSTKIKKLDLSGLTNLQDLNISQFMDLKTIKVGKNTKLKKVFVSECKKLKSVDLAGCKKLKDVRIYYTGLEKIKIGKINKITFIDLAYNNIKKINVTGKYIKHLGLEGNKIKEVDVSRLKKLKSIGVSKNTKVFKSKGKSLKVFRYGKNFKLLKKQVNK